MPRPSMIGCMLSDVAKCSDARCADEGKKLRCEVARRPAVSARATGWTQR